MFKNILELFSILGVFLFGLNSVIYSLISVFVVSYWSYVVNLNILYVLFLGSLLWSVLTTWTQLIVVIFAYFAFNNRHEIKKVLRNMATVIKDTDNVFVNITPQIKNYYDKTVLFIETTPLIIDIRTWVHTLCVKYENVIANKKTEIRSRAKNTKVIKFYNFLEFAELSLIHFIESFALLLVAINIKESIDLSGFKLQQDSNKNDEEIEMDDLDSLLKKPKEQKANANMMDDICKVALSTLQNMDKNDLKNIGNLMENFNPDAKLRVRSRTRKDS